MPDEYEPTLMDVAKMLYATGGQGPAPEVLSLVGWLMERAPEVRELWKTVNEPLEGSVTFRDLMDLHVCLHHEHPSERAYGMAVWLLRRMPETARLWSRLEQMGEDAGCPLQYPAYAVDVVRFHGDVDRLLAADDWATAEGALDPTGKSGTCYDEWLRVVDARLARGEGDAERLREVRGRLRAEAAFARQRPALEAELPLLARVLPAQGNRDRLADVFAELSSALRSDEPPAPQLAPPKKNRRA